MATPESGTGKYYVEGKPTKKQLEVRAQQAKNKAASDRGRMAESLKQARKNVGASTCWDGYTAKGTKKKGGKVVPNCVKEEEVDEGVLVNLAKGTERAVSKGVKKFNKLDAKVTKAAGKVAKKTLAATGRGVAGAVGGAIKGAYQGASKGVKKGLKETALEILENSRRKKEEVTQENRQVAYEPEKHKDPDESDKPYSQRSRAARMRDPKRGINSPAFKKFMADRGMSASYEPTLPMVESKKKL